MPIWSPSRKGRFTSSRSLHGWMTTQELRLYPSSATFRPTISGARCITARGTWSNHNMNAIKRRLRRPALSCTKSTRRATLVVRRARRLLSVVGSKIKGSSRLTDLPRDPPTFQNNRRVKLSAPSSARTDNIYRHPAAFSPWFPPGRHAKHVKATRSAHLFMAGTSEGRSPDRQSKAFGFSASTRTGMRRRMGPASMLTTTTCGTNGTEQHGPNEMSRVP